MADGVCVCVCVCVCAPKKGIQHRARFLGATFLCPSRVGPQAPTTSSFSSVGGGISSCKWIKPQPGSAFGENKLWKCEDLFLAGRAISQSLIESASLVAVFSRSWEGNISTSILIVIAKYLLIYERVSRNMSAC